MHKVGADRAILICPGGFNSGVYAFVKNLPIDLVGLKELTDLINNAFPQTEQTNISTQSSCCSLDKVFVFKSIENLSVLYTSYEKGLYNQMTKKFELHNRRSEGIFIFESIKLAEIIVEEIKKNGI